MSNNYLCPICRDYSMHKTEKGFVCESCGEVLTKKEYVLNYPVETYFDGVRWSYDFYKPLSGREIAGAFKTRVAAEKAAYRAIEKFYIVMGTEDIFNETREMEFNANAQDQFLKSIRNSVENLQNGYGDALLFVANLKEVIESLESAKNRVEDIAISELSNSLQGNERSYTKHGYQFSISQSGRYSYKHFDGYNSKSNELKEIEEKMKIALKQGGTYIDPETGEIYPAAEYNQSKKSITIKKSKL